MYMPLLAAALLVLRSDNANAHSVAWTKGMYCKNGLSAADEPNASLPAEPLVNDVYDDWFMHGPCRNYPPPANEFLEIPAGGSFTAELAPNRAATSLSYNGSLVTGWGDGKNHTDDYSAANPGGFALNGVGCIGSPNLHTKDQAGAAGTVFAIAYQNDISKVTLADLTVFSVAANTPYKLVATYEVPAAMPECPAAGCICAWGWVPNHCGESNIYMNAYRCIVTNVRRGALKLAAPQPPVWCEGAPGACVKGAKQMVIAYQAQSNNVNLTTITGYQLDGQLPSPGYNLKMGFSPGAQNDIFLSVPSISASALSVSSPSRALLALGAVLVIAGWTR